MDARITNQQIFVLLNYRASIEFLYNQYDFLGFFRFHSVSYSKITSVYKKPAFYITTNSNRITRYG
jgi:hypothetical protein